MKINKLRLKIRLKMIPILCTQKEIKMTYLVFVFCYLMSLRLWSHLEDVLSTFKILSYTVLFSTTQNLKHRLFSYILLLIQSPTNSHRVWAACAGISFPVCRKRNSKSHHFLAKKRESSHQARDHSVLTYITE